jgi:hypothetical protein
MLENKKNEIYAQLIELTKEKIETNTIRTKFYGLEMEVDKIANNFYEIFPNLDELCENADNLANEIRIDAINIAMEITASYEIYSLSEKEFYNNFMQEYEAWNRYFDPISDQYEEILDNTTQLDTYRTARRKNRSQWVGFSKEAVYEADAKNLISNVGHGVFNLVAKGITAIGNSIKKDEILKHPSTKKQIIYGLQSIVAASCSAVLEFMKTAHNSNLYIYSDDEISKTSVIVENIKKGRIPEEKILLSLVKAIEYYPYNRDVYVLLLIKFGGSNYQLDSVVKYFGILDLEGEKKELFNTFLKNCDISSKDKLEKFFPELEQYARHICYKDFNLVLNELVETKHFDNARSIGRIEERFIELVTKGFVTNPDCNFYVRGELPNNKIKSFMQGSKYKINESEILFYVDNTFFHGGEDGVIIDLNSIIIKLLFEEEHCIPLKNIESVTIKGIFDKEIILKIKESKNISFTLTQSNKGAKFVYDVLLRIINLQI